MTQVLSECGLTMDVATDETVEVGDWIRTSAGSRYLVLAARRVNERVPSQRSRFAVRAGRLPRGCEIPDEVPQVWLMRWYRRVPVTVPAP